MTGKEIRRVGFHLGWGLIYAVCTWIVLTLLFMAAADGLGLRPLDNTDARDGTRSGVKLRTDFGTGCQYLETSGGGITPRLGPDDKQVCRD